jgi:hypothetical protein
MFHLDYLSCFLTVLATILLARKSWIGLLVATVNSLIVCAIGFRTSQLGFVPANLFCICVYGLSMRSWLKKQTPTNRDQAQRENGSVADGPRIELRLPDTDALGLNIFANLHRPPVVFMSRKADIESSGHMAIRNVITNDASSKIGNHV